MDDTFQMHQFATPAKLSLKRTAIEVLEGRIAMSADVGLLLTAPQLDYSTSATGDHQFTEHFSSAHSVVLDAGGSWSFADDVSIEGDLIITGAAEVSFLGKVSVTGKIRIEAGSSITFSDALEAGSDVQLLSGEVDFLGGAQSVRVARDLSISHFTPGATLQIGFSADSGAALDITDTDLAAVLAGGKLGLGAHDSHVLVESATFAGKNIALQGFDVTVQQSLTAKGATVNLSAGNIVRNDGVIDVSAGPGFAAGKLTLAGNYVGNFGTIQATGSHMQPGGQVELTSTTQTLVSPAATIDVSGSHGGSIRLWSDTNTTMAGQLVARGLAQGGKGGFVEVSSVYGLTLTGHTDTTSAGGGEAGVLLIDPRDVMIGGISNTTLPQLNSFTTIPTTDASIEASVLNAQASPILIQANRDIYVDAALNLNTSLTLQAGRSVYINSNITLANQSLSITANDPLSINGPRDVGEGSVVMAHGRTINAGNGTITLTAAVGDTPNSIGGVLVDRVITTGTLNIASAGYVRETTGDLAPTMGNMTSENDLTAGTLNFSALSTSAIFGEGLGTGNGALEIAAGTVSATSVAGFNGSFVLTDADYTAAPLTLGSFDAKDGTVVLTALGDSIVGAAAGTQLTAGQVNLTTTLVTDALLVPHAGSIGSAALPFRTNIATLTATSANGGLYLSEASDLFINKVTVQDMGVTPQSGADGAIVILPSGGSATAGTSNASISVSGNVTLLEAKVANELLLTASGMILDGNQDATNVLARTAYFGGAGVGQASDTIETTVMTLGGSSSTGGFYITESDALTIQNISATGTGNDVSISSGAGAIKLGVISAAGGTITLKSGFDTIVDDNAGATNLNATSINLEARNGLGSSGDALEITAGNVTTKVTTAASGTYLSNSAGLTTLNVETNGGAVDVTHQMGALTFSGGSSSTLAYTGGALTFNNTGGKIVLGLVNAGVGTVALTSKLGMEDGNGSALNLVAGPLTLNSGAGIGTSSEGLETMVSSLNATANAGGVYVANGGTLALTAAAKGTGNDVTVSAAGDLIVAKVSAPDEVTLTSQFGKILRSGTAVHVAGATVSLSSSTGMGTSAEPLILSAATLTSATASTNGIYLRAKGALTASSITAPLGDVVLTGDGAITLGSVQAGANKEITINAAGSLLDGNVNAPNLQGGKATLSAAQIGTAIDALETDLATLNAFASAGLLNISEADAITVERIEAQGQGANVTFNAGGSIILSTAKAEGDIVTLVSGGSIQDGNGAALNITADKLNITAATGIDPLQNKLNQLGTASGGTGGVVLSNTGTLALTEATIEGISGLVTISADVITLLDVADSVAQIAAGGSIRLVSKGDVVFLDKNDTIRTSGSGSITIEAGLGLTPAYPDTGAVAIIGNLETGGGNISVRANHHISLGLLNAGSGNVTVVSETGSLIDNNGSTANIIGGAVTLGAHTMQERAAQLETTNRIADYSAYRSEAAAKLSSFQSFTAATAIMKVQRDRALGEQDDAEDALAEAEAEQADADQDALIAYIAASVAEGVATGLGITRDIVAIPAGAAQAIPFTGDGGAMGGYSALDVAANVADVAAFAARIVADQFGDIAEAAANLKHQRDAELTALSAVYQDSLATWKAFDEATSIAEKASIAAAIHEVHSLRVRDQAVMAEDQANSIGTSGAGLQIQATSINATSSNGSIYLDVTGSTTLTGASATGAESEISIQASGNITVNGALTAPKLVALKSGGSIGRNGANLAATITSTAFSAEAVGAIGQDPLLLDVSTVALKADGGDARIFNTGALTIGTVGVLNGITAAGSAAVSTGGDLTIAKPVSSSGSMVQLVSTTGAILNTHTGSPDVVGSLLVFAAEDGIAVDTKGATIQAEVLGAGNLTINELDAVTISAATTFDGAISITAGGALTVTNAGSSTDADGNDITLTATTGNLQVGNLYAGAVGDAHLSAPAGEITVTNSVVADALYATSGAGINVVDSIVTSVDLSVTNAGHINLSENSDLVVTRAITAHGHISLNSAGGSIRVAEAGIHAGGSLAGGNVTLSTLGSITGPIAANSVADVVGTNVLLTSGIAGGIGASLLNPLEVKSTGVFTVQTDSHHAYVEATEGGIRLDGSTLGTGEFHLKALNGSIVSATPLNGTVDLVAGLVDLTVTGAASTIGTSEAERLHFNGATLTLKTAGGSAYLQEAAGGIALNSLETGAGSLFLSATGGAITDNNHADLNITAGKLALVATGGVGTTNNALEIKTANFEGSGGADGIFLQNSTAALTLGGVTSNLAGLAGTGSRINITTAGSLTVSEAVSNPAGEINFTTVDTSAAGENVLVDADLTANDVSMAAGDDLTVAAGVTITGGAGAGFGVMLQGDWYDADAGVGATLTLTGALRGHLLRINTGDDADTIIIKDANVTTTMLSTNAGADTVTITAGNLLATSVANLGDGADTLYLSSSLSLLLGEAGNDQLVLKQGGGIDTFFQGGADFDTVTYDHDGMDGDDIAGPVTLNLQTEMATSISGFATVERFEAPSNLGNALTGANVNSAWHLTGANTGNIGGVGVFEFSNFNHLSGGSADDSFAFAPGASLTGVLHGGGATTRDKVSYEADNYGAAVSVTLESINSGTATGIGGGFLSIEEIAGDSDFTAENALNGFDGTTTWTMTGDNQGHLNSLFYFQEMGKLAGGDADSTFTVDNNSLVEKPIVGGDGYNVLDLSGWTGPLRWYITADNAGYVITPLGQINFSGISSIKSGAGNDVIQIAQDVILGGGLATPGALDAGAGHDYLDLAGYTARNLWSRTGLNGNISTDDGQWTYAGVEEFLGSEATTYRFDVVDLTAKVDAIKLPAQVLPGAKGSITMSIANIGNDEVFKQLVDVKFFLSLDNKLDDGDILLATGAGKSINIFQGDSRQPFSVNALVPAGTAAGDYQIIAVLDDTNSVPESDERNNVLVAGSVEVLAETRDLGISLEQSTFAADVLPGAKGVLRAKVSNLGNSPIVGTGDVEFFLSLDGNIDGSDIALGGFTGTSLNLLPGASKSLTFNGTIPAGLTAGDYRVLVRVDGQNTIAEGNEGNNVAEALNPVHVSAPGVDLQVGVANAKIPNIAIPNDILRFDVPIKNLGNIPLKTKVSVSYYLSADGTLDGDDVLLKTLDNVALNLKPGGQVTLKGTGTIPTSVTGGTYYVLAQVDSTGLVAETSETNNVASSTNTAEVVWRFGNFGDRRGVKLSVPDANGNIVTFAMSGEGAGDLIGAGDFSTLNLVGTNPKTAINISVKGGQSTTLFGLNSTNSLGSINAPKVNLEGDLTINGTIRNLKMGNVSDGTITLGADARLPKGPTLNFGTVTDVSFSSTGHVHWLFAKDWLDDDGQEDTIFVPTIEWLLLGNTDVDIVANAMDTKNISITHVHVDGDFAGTISAFGGINHVMADSVTGATIEGQFGNQMDIYGDITNSDFLFAGNTVRKPSPATAPLHLYNITGNVIDSIIAIQNDAVKVSAGKWSGSILAVGATDGGDGDYFDGDEVATTGTLLGFRAKAFEATTVGVPYGILADRFTGAVQFGATKLTPAQVPFANGDLRVNLI